MGKQGMPKLRPALHLGIVKKQAHQYTRKTITNVP
jgi:hypothetical protein